MSGIQKDILYHAMRIQTQFEDDLGNPIKLVSGSGFCVLHKKQVCFITNKHNLDPKLKLGENTSYKLKNVSIEYRIVINPQMLGSETAFCEINNFNSKIVFSEEADVAVIKIDPIVIINGRQYGCKFLSVMEMANQDFLSRKVSPMDVASFIGFPGNPLTPWWDTKVNYGIARVVNIASFPHESFSNPAIKTKDVTLVNGLSFGGSSGSMVILHKKGIKSRR